MFALACLAFLPAVAAAQSQFSGEVRDESGGVLPGVTVEASSPVLIEKAKTAVTDAAGRYAIVDLRPGVYKLTFSLSGFSTVVRDGIDLPSNFVASVNADLKVGTLEETITVSGQTPLVDVSQAAKTQVLSRDLVDSLPGTRTFMTMGSIVPGIRTGAPDVGGNRQVVQNAMNARGVQGRNTSVNLDGMSINGALNQGGSMPYMNEGVSQEVTISIGALPAEVSKAGVMMNSIPRDGGNFVSGSVFLGGSDGAWQSNNADPSKLKNVRQPAGSGHIQNFNVSVGGPVLKNRLWYFLSGRHVASTELIINGFLADGTKMVQDQYIRNATGRLTWQATQQHKFVVHIERQFKQFGHDGYAVGVDESATVTRDPDHGNYNLGQAKWTGTLSSRWMVEAGFSTNLQSYVATPQPSVLEPRGTAAWYANARRTSDVLVKAPGCALTTGCTAWGGAATAMRNGLRQALHASGTYVTGSHTLKFGVQHQFGPEDEGQDRLADLTQIYRGVTRIPFQVTIENTPRRYNANLDYESGVFVQDSWTIKRLTLNPGFRFEWFQATSEDSYADAGRFLPARFFPAFTQNTNWKRLPVPRFAAAYNLFGDGRTAIKGNISKYYESWSAEFITRYSPIEAQTSTFNWNDLNGDDIAQEIEFLPNGCITCGSNANFGTTRVVRASDPNLKRAHNWEYSLAVQHQLLQGVAITAGYYLRSWKNVEVSDNTLVSREDWLGPAGTEFTVTNPLNRSQLLKAYQLSPRVRGQSFTLDTTDPDFQSNYQGVEVSGTARLRNGSILFGGWTMERNRTVSCGASSDNPNSTGTDKYLGNLIATGLQADPDGTLWCDQTSYNIPFGHDFKLSGTLPLWFGIESAMSLQNLSGRMYGRTYTLVNNQFPGGSSVGTAQTILLDRPGMLYYPRLIQIDVNLQKHFRLGRRSLSFQVDWFNVTNSSSILGTTNTIVNIDGGGPDVGNVTSFLAGRIPRVVLQYKF